MGSYLRATSPGLQITRNTDRAGISHQKRNIDDASNIHTTQKRNIDDASNIQDLDHRPSKKSRTESADGDYKRQADQKSRIYHFSTENLSKNPSKAQDKCDTTKHDPNLNKTNSKDDFTKNEPDSNATKDKDEVAKDEPNQDEKKPEDKPKVSTSEAVMLSTMGSMTLVQGGMQILQTVQQIQTSYLTSQAEQVKQLCSPV